MREKETEGDRKAQLSQDISGFGLLPSSTNMLRGNRSKLCKGERDREEKKVYVMSGYMWF